ncbi:MAG: hypothetical protein WCA04_15905 [Geobacteraceae bacterium]
MKSAAILALFAVLMLPGCSSLVFPTSSPPVYYGLDYLPEANPCGKHLEQGLRIWSFGAASPYDRREMIVKEDGGKISFSRDFQWVAPPGILLSDCLLRDIREHGPFLPVVSDHDPVPVSFDMTGRILTFAWERSENVSRAVLDLEVSVTPGQSSQGASFFQRYTLRSAPVEGEGTSEDFARAMGLLTSQASRKIGQDLCVFAGRVSGQGNETLPQQHSANPHE